MTHTVPGVESLSEAPRRNASITPSGESAGRISPTVLNVIGTTAPPSVRTA